MERSLSISRSRNAFDKQLPLNWFTAASIESLYGSLLKPGVDASNPSLISFIKAEGLPELVCCSQDGISSYMDIKMNHISGYCYSKELSDFVQQRGIKIKKLWIIATDSYFDALIDSFKSFVSSCPIQNVYIDLSPCGVTQDYCETVNGVLYKVDRVLGSFYNNNAEHLVHEQNANVLIQHPEFELPTARPHDSGLKLKIIEPHYISSDNISMMSPMSDVGSPLLSRSLSFKSATEDTLRPQSETDDSYESSLLSKESSQLLPTPLTSPSIHIKQNPFDANPIPNILDSLTGNALESYTAPIIKIDTIRLETISSHLLTTILLLERRWKIKNVEIVSQNSFEELEAAIESNIDLITALKSNMYLPIVTVKFKDNKLFNKSIFNFTADNFIKRVDHIRSIYPSLNFFCGLGFDDFTNLKFPNKVDAVLNLIKPIDIKFIKQDSRIPIDKDQNEIREWRKLIALFENLEEVIYKANLSETGSILSTSWSKLNWFWKSYNKLERMSFDFTCTKKSMIKNDSRTQIIELPSGIKILTLNLDLACTDLRILDLTKIIKMKNSNLSHLTINFKNHSDQTNITIITDEISSIISVLELNACRFSVGPELKVTFKPSNPNTFVKIIQDNCYFS